MNEALQQADVFFAEVEHACEELREQSPGRGAFGDESSTRNRPGRQWTELRIRRPELVQDNVTLPLQRVRTAVSELIKSSDDEQTGHELMECNRRLGELREELALFLSQEADDYVYWVERGGRGLRNITVCAAPIDVAAYLRRRLFGSDTSIIMTSATLAVAAGDPRWARNKAQNAAAGC